jgi:cellulose synthase/poly-beta-1,6-N-acetylglucosamine synthase-like glycosyltransferase
MSVMTEDRPLVSVVIETVAARFGTTHGTDLVAELERALTGVARQTYPAELIETVVVVDRAVAADQREMIRRRFPWVRFAESSRTNYFAAKNAGAGTARGSIVAMLDGDCEPTEQWVERLVSRLEPGVAAVAGRTRYAANRWQARILSVPGLGYVLEASDGTASGINLNNVAFHRDVLREHPLDERIRRNGGCVLLYHQLRAAGKRVVYEPGAVTEHSDGDVLGTQFISKHFGRGFDNVAVYRNDDLGVLRGTLPFRRYGLVALAGITARRILHDWVVLARHRDQIGIQGRAVPFYCVLAVALRSVEFAGMAAAVRNPDQVDR